MEFLDVGAHVHQRIFNLGDNLRVAAVGVFAQILQNHGNDLGGRIEEIHAALCQLLHVAWIQDQIHAVERRIRTQRLP